MFTALLVLGAFVAGAMVNGKLFLPALHKLEPGPIRDALLKALNGGSGPLPK